MAASRAFHAFRCRIQRRPTVSTHQLVPWRDETPSAVRGAIALVDVPLMRTPADFPVLLAGAVTGEADTDWRCYDPGGTLAGN